MLKFSDAFSQFSPVILISPLIHDEMNPFFLWYLKHITIYFCLLIIFFNFLKLGIKPKTLHLPGRHYIAELHPGLLLIFLESSIFLFELSIFILSHLSSFPHGFLWPLFLSKAQMLKFFHHFYTWFLLFSLTSDQRERILGQCEPKLCYHTIISSNYWIKKIYTLALVCAILL